MITNDRQEKLFVAMCEDRLCHHIAAGGGTLNPGDSMAPMVKPFTDVPFAVKAVGAGNNTCLLLVLDKDIDKSYGLSALIPCKP